MDKDMHQGHEPEHVDLTQVEGAPGARVDPLFERQIDDASSPDAGFGPTSTVTPRSTHPLEPQPPCSSSCSRQPCPPPAWQQPAERCGQHLG